MTAKQIRIVLGTVLVALVSGLFALDGALGSRVAGSLVASALGLAGYVEFARIAGLSGRGGEGSSGSAGWQVLGGVGFCGTACFLALGWMQAAGVSWVSGESEAEWVVGGVVAVVFAAFGAVLFRRDYVAAFQKLPASVLGVLLFGLCYSYLLRIYHLDDGILVGVVYVLGVKGTDISAYLVGTAVGRHKYLHVSPGKSVEGSLAGLAFGGIWFGGAGAVWPESFFGWSWGIAFGIILAVVSAMGDLAESLLKRAYGVKDSGALLPEFGGVLDLIDSFTFSGFLFWCLLSRS